MEENSFTLGGLDGQDWVRNGQVAMEIVGMLYKEFSGQHSDQYTYWYKHISPRTVFADYDGFDTFIVDVFFDAKCEHVYLKASVRDADIKEKVMKAVQEAMSVSMMISSMEE